MENNRLDLSYRLLDANFNRAREGVRVVEEILRFVYHEEEIASALKKLRHKLAKIGRKIYPRLIGARNVNSDFYRDNREGSQEKLKDVILANFRRAEEALRTLEEFSKLVSSRAGREFKRVRFKVYDLEKRTAEKIF